MEAGASAKRSGDVVAQLRSSPATSAAISSASSGSELMQAPLLASCSRASNSSIARSRATPPAWHSASMHSRARSRVTHTSPT